MPKRPSELRPEWDALQAEAAALAAEPAAEPGPKAEAKEARAAMLAVKKDLLATAAWVGEAHDIADVLLLAEVCWDLWWGLGTFPQLPADIDDRDQREVAVAYLVRGIVDAAAAQAVPLPPARREPSGTLVAEIARMVGSVAEDEAAIGVLSTGEAIAVALVLNRADLLPQAATAGSRRSIASGRSGSRRRMPCSGSATPETRSFNSEYRTSWGTTHDGTDRHCADPAAPPAARSRCPTS